MAKLTPKQEAFCREYLIDLNATQAAIRAGYSKKTARSQGQRLLTKADIAATLEKALAKRSERTEITADRVLQELALMGFANMEDYIQTQDDGTAYVDLSKLSRDQAAAIQEIVTEEYMEGRGEEAVPVRKIKFKLHARCRALELLGKHLGLFIERHEITHSAKVVKVPATDRPEDWQGEFGEAVEGEQPAAEDIN